MTKEQRLSVWQNQRESCRINGLLQKREKFRLVCRKDLAQTPVPRFGVFWEPVTGDCWEWGETSL